jgi:signal transduction histidine kinase
VALVPTSLAAVKKRLGAIALGLALLVAIAPPVGVIGVHQVFLREELRGESSILATRVAQHAFLTGPMWKFQGHILVEMIKFPELGEKPVWRGIEVEGGVLVAEFGSKPQWPVFAISVPIRIGDAEIARLTSATSLRSELLLALLVAGLSTLVAAMLYFVVHVSPLKMLDQSVAAMTSALDDAATANRTKSEFLANMSHELRTPLNAIIGFAQVIEGQILGPINVPKYRDYAADIAASGSHLLELINDILDISKIEANRLELHLDRINLEAIARRCERLVAVRAQEAGLALVVESDDDVPPIAGEELRLKQILINFLSNAIKFTPKGGKVTLRIQRTPEGGASVAVTDTGIGMRPQDIPVALERFRQVDGSHTRKAGGTGLGLPIAKALIEAHGGRFEIRSVLGKGTTVTAIFPSMSEATASPAAAAEPDLAQRLRAAG